MAYVDADLQTLFGGTAQQLHAYNSADAVATVAGSGYFNNGTNRLRQFDMIMVAGSTGGTATADLLIVTSATGASTVTTTNGT
ncbi:MAG: hypothetical protein ACR2QF_11865 [Geminicoccaceae bacterium]